MSTADDRNSGDKNSGYGNSGDRNSGDKNSGYGNSGDGNSGNWNSGNWNSGYENSGNWNSGNRNSGYGNSGNRNSGHRNSGDFNSGYGNSGNWNSGDWNSGNRNSGYFCTGTPSPLFFDAPTTLTWEEADELVPWIDLPVGCVWVPEVEMSLEERQAHPNYETLGGFLKTYGLSFKDAFRQAWGKLDDGTRQRFLDLPNFDPDKFLEITGVDVREDSPLKAGDEFTFERNGRTYTAVVK